MTKLSSVLKKLISEHTLNTAELARQTGVLQPVIHRIVSGETDNPKIGTLLPIANYFGISINELIGEETVLANQNVNPSMANNTLHKIPLLNWQEIKEWPNIIKRGDRGYIETSNKLCKNSYAVAVKDSTMLPRFPEGTILIIDTSLVPQDQDFVIVQTSLQNEPLFKQVFFDGDDIYLKPVNPDFKTLFLDKSINYHYLGILVEARTLFKQI